MLSRLYAGIAGLALVGFVTPAMAANVGDPVDVDITVTVEEIAFLEVIEAAGQMTIDDASDSFMGQPSSTGSVFNAAAGQMAVVQLSTNFDVDAIDINFPRINGIRGFSSADYFGEAIGSSTGNTLGVWPQAGYLDGSGNINGGGGGIYFHSGGNTSFQVTGTHRQNDNNGFGAGVHQFGIGVSTNWTRTLVGEPEFAEPDDYQIQITASIVATP